MSYDTITIMVTIMMMKIDFWPRQAFFPSYSPNRCTGQSKRKILKKRANQDITRYIFKTIYLLYNFLHFECINNRQSLSIFVTYMGHRP